MKTIQLPHGFVALVDDEDYERIACYSWYRIRSGYAVRFTSRKMIPWGRRCIYMHKEIMGFPDCEVDHRSSDKLNNQKSNLRECSRQQNCSNQQLSVANTSGYKGVYQALLSKRWAARTKFHGKCIHIGTFETPELAAFAYNEKAKELFGEFARLNPV